MNRIYVFLYCFFLASGSVQAQQVFKTTPTSTIAYLEYVPADYVSNSDKYPIVFFFHGIGERGANTTDLSILETSVQDVTTHGPPKLVKNGTKFPFILISPQLKSNYGQWTSAYIMEVINHCKTYLRIDEKRIYVTGLSLGGGGTWVAAQDFPELFAAIAPVCGGYNSTSKACGMAKENLPVWAFHGDKDSVVPLSRSQNMVNAINACTPQPSPLAKMSIYPGVGHNAWDYAYKNDNTLHTPNVYEWLMSYTNTINAGNRIPTANAGADKIVGLTNVTINGSGADSDGTIASYSWSKISGSSVTMTNVNTAALTLTNLSLGTYVFKLTVTDNTGNTDSDYVTVTASASNEIPVCSAGADKSITLPTNALTLTGTATDSDGTISTYKWTQVSGALSTLSNSTASTLTVNNLLEGSYIFKLCVTDNQGATDTDEVMVTVQAPIVPVVNAGADKLVKLPTSYTTITGSAKDTGGTIVGYTWTKISGASCTMTNTTGASLKLSSLTSGKYCFKLTAKDNDGYVASDDVTITVDAPPTANAGSDKTVTLPMSTSIYLNGTGTDSDGVITSYLWSKYSGPNVSVENTRSATLKINKLYAGVYVFKLQVTDDLGVKAFDYVTITVNASATTTTTSSRSATEHAEPFSSIDLDFGNETVLGKRTLAELKECTVVVFDQNGEQVYSGAWSAEVDRDILKQGMYIYNVVKAGVRVDSGKIYKKDI